MDHSSGTESFPSLTNTQIKTLISRINNKEKINIEGISYYETANFSNNFILDYRTKVLIAMSAENFTKRMIKSERESFQTKFYKQHINGLHINIFIIRTKTKFTPQSLFDSFRTSIQNTRALVSQVTDIYSKGKSLFF